MPIVMNSSNKAIPFAIYYAGDAYSTANKIMGRQSAGKAFIKGLARAWPSAIVYGLGDDAHGGQALARQMSQHGYHGEVRWNHLPQYDTAKSAGALYYPAPPAKDLAQLRNMSGAQDFSLIGITHTLSSAGAIDQIADLIMPPFKPWDALICTSQCAKDFTKAVHTEMQDWWRDQIGAVRFSAPQLPVIPLGIDAPAFVSTPEHKRHARQALGVANDDVLFLFSGRLTFHAKANPIPMYQALEKAAQHQPIVCVEAGIFPNEAIKQAYLRTQQAIAPSVKFIWANGEDDTQYRNAWQAADVFVSLSDNIQETFGLTPLEAKATGLPVIVADWNGYKDTVRHGIDGFRVPTTLPPAGCGDDLAIRHAVGTDNYDYFIGRTSLATVVDPAQLAAIVSQLAQNESLRQSMGAAGATHAQQVYDWPVVLQRYAELTEQLAILRQQSEQEPPRKWPQRADPFARFAHFSTTTLRGNWTVHTRADAMSRFQTLLSLNMANYGFDPKGMSQETALALLSAAEKNDSATVNTLLTVAGCPTPAGFQALMWLWKFDLVHISPSI